jgi:two-component system, OmpR family, response regulator
MSRGGARGGRVPRALGRYRRGRAGIKDRAPTIDWLFTDIRLPGCIDGWRVADEFRLTHPFRPVVYATAYAPGETRPQLHGSLIFRKPYRPAEIVAAFRRLSTELQGATTNA